MRPNPEPTIGHGRAFQRLAALLVSAALLVPGPALMLAPAARADTAPQCEGLLKYDAGTYTCTVPAWVTSLAYVVVGGPGGSSQLGLDIYGPGGSGAQVSGTLAVTPGETLTLTVGAWGQRGGLYGGTGYAGSWRRLLEHRARG